MTNGHPNTPKRDPHLPLVTKPLQPWENRPPKALPTHVIRKRSERAFVYWFEPEKVDPTSFIGCKWVLTEEEATKYFAHEGMMRLRDLQSRTDTFKEAVLTRVEGEYVPGPPREQLSDAQDAAAFKRWISEELPERVNMVVGDQMASQILLSEVTRRLDAERDRLKRVAERKERLEAGAEQPMPVGDMRFTIDPRAATMAAECLRRGISIEALFALWEKVCALGQDLTTSPVPTAIVDKMQAEIESLRDLLDARSQEIEALRANISGPRLTRALAKLEVLVQKVRDGEHIEDAMRELMKD